MIESSMGVRMSVRYERNEERDKKQCFATRKSIFIVSCLVHLFGFGHTHRCPITPRRPLIGITNLYFIPLALSAPTVGSYPKKTRKSTHNQLTQTARMSARTAHLYSFTLAWCVCVVFFVCSAHTPCSVLV